jgi:DNA polymerase-3 subunit epsilon
MRKVIYYDTETTGLDPVKNGIIQFAAIIEIDGKVEDEMEYQIKPFPDDKIDPKALEVNEITPEEILTNSDFMEPTEAYKSIKKAFGRFIDPYNKDDKFQPAGYNVRFDQDMMKAFWQKNGDKYFGSWMNWHFIDPLPVLHFMEGMELCKLVDYKLETVCGHFTIPIKAHDALSDIRATRELILSMQRRLKDVGVL